MYEYQLFTQPSFPYAPVLAYLYLRPCLPVPPPVPGGTAKRGRGYITLTRGCAPQRFFP